MRASALSISAWALASLCGCAAPGPVAVAENQPMNEKVLAARKLQRPLSSHLCRAAIYPATEKGWQVSRVATLSGRGPTFLEALEALCREADGLRLPAVVDIYYFRAPDGWSETHEVRGVGVSYDEGFKPPAPPNFVDIKPPSPPQRGTSEPAPSGEAR